MTSLYVYHNWSVYLASVSVKKNISKLLNCVLLFMFFPDKLNKYILCLKAFQSSYAYNKVRPRQRSQTNPGKQTINP